jgi:hypothetical protein
LVILSSALNYVCCCYYSCPDREIDSLSLSSPPSPSLLVQILRLTTSSLLLLRSTSLSLHFSACLKLTSPLLLLYYRYGSGADEFIKAEIDGVVVALMHHATARRVMAVLSSCAGHKSIHVKAKAAGWMDLCLHMVGRAGAETVCLELTLLLSFYRWDCTAQPKEGETWTAWFK